MKCEYDKFGFKACLSCKYSDCQRDDILEDEFSPEPEEEHDNFWEEVYGVPTVKGTQRKNGIYKGTIYDDERHRKAREYDYRKKHGIPQPIRMFKRKGRETEYLREYRANMPEEQRERYRKWQREYAREKRRREREGA